VHEKVLPKGSRAVLARVEEIDRPQLQAWTLAGGTGLALRLGHRVSKDFDFFRTEGMSADSLHSLFRRMGEYETLQEASNTLTVLVSGTTLSFFQVPDPFLFPPTPYRCFFLADLRDIALMKLAAISGRGSRKDFVDLYTCLRSGARLQGFFDLLPRKYGAGRANIYHILKSLTYFEDAEQEPMPAMLEPFNWEECKNFFVREAHAIVLAP